MVLPWNLTILWFNLLLLRKQYASHIPQQRLPSFMKKVVDGSTLKSYNLVLQSSTTTTTICKPYPSTASSFFHDGRNQIWLISRKSKLARMDFGNNMNKNPRTHEHKCKRWVLTGPPRDQIPSTISENTKLCSYEPENIRQQMTHVDTQESH